MGCGCKKKTQQQNQTNSNNTQQKAVQEGITKVVEKYYQQPKK